MYFLPPMHCSASLVHFPRICSSITLHSVLSFLFPPLSFSFRCRYPSWNAAPSPGRAKILALIHQFMQSAMPCRHHGSAAAPRRPPLCPPHWLGLAPFLPQGKSQEHITARTSPSAADMGMASSSAFLRGPCVVVWSCLFATQVAWDSRCPPGDLIFN